MVSVNKLKRKAELLRYWREDFDNIGKKPQHSKFNFSDEEVADILIELSSSPLVGNKHSLEMSDIDLILKETEDEMKNEKTMPDVWANKWFRHLFIPICGTVLAAIVIFSLNLNSNKGFSSENNLNTQISGAKNIVIYGSNNSVNISAVTDPINSDTVTTSTTFSIEKNYGYRNIHVNRGGSQTLFDGRFVLGLINVGVYGDAEINLNLNKSFRKVYAGDTCPFMIDGQNYTLVISEIHYVLDYVSFDVYSESDRDNFCDRGIITR